MKKRIDVILELLNNSDVLFLQETLIGADQLDFASSLSAEFSSAHTHSYDPCLHGEEGRPRGGLSIYWRRSLLEKVTPIKYSDNIMGLRISVGPINYLLLNIYMPCDIRTFDSLVNYRNMCAEIESILESEPECESIHKILIIGDFNADPIKGRFWAEIEKIVTNKGLFVADSVLPMDSFTYLSAAHNSTSWLDHIITSDKNCIKEVNILYGKTIFDHIPVSVLIEFPTNAELKLRNLSSINAQDFIMWENLTEQEIEAYNCGVHTELNNYYNESLCCSIQNCDSECHKKQLDNAYEFLITTLVSNSANYTLKGRERKFKQVAGWNQECKLLHSVAREKFLIWNSNGKVRCGYDFEQMKQSRAAFRHAFRVCKRDENNIKNRYLSESFALKNKKQFWKDVNKLKSKEKFIVDTMDGVNDSEGIIDVFDRKFKSVFDDKNCQGILHDNDSKINKLKENLKISTFKIFDFNVAYAIDSINTCIGCDGLHSNHFKLCKNGIQLFLSRLFSSFLLHGYMPSAMLRGEIRPIIKDKLGSMSNSENYRPITIATNCLKIFEYCIVGNLNNSITLDPNQFGFRKDTSTIMAISMLKETVMNYNRNGSKVYSAFLDLSKAFDKVNHNTLMYKLIDSRVSPIIVNILLHMYGNQNVNVAFNGAIGDSWRLRNGVRQGGIISPLLFNFYINDILLKLREMSVGCRLGIYKHNIQAYADDLTLLAPSAYALQKLIDKIYMMLKNLNLTLNAKKSVCMVFESSRCAKSPPQNFCIDGHKMTMVKSYNYLGVVINFNLLNSEDIQRCETSFLKQFYSIFRKFNYAQEAVMLFLFKSHCMSMYGAELWYDIKGSRSFFNSFAINYHKCIKKMIGSPWRESNHVVCERTCLPLFKHFINWKNITLAFNLLNTKSVCMGRHKCFLIHDSVMFKVIKKNFYENYLIEDVFDNDIDAIKARIGFVQEREECSRGAFVVCNIPVHHNA
jgi:hypothetical protein